MCILEVLDFFILFVRVLFNLFFFLFVNCILVNSELFFGFLIHDLDFTDSIICIICSHFIFGEVVVAEGSLFGVGKF